MKIVVAIYSHPEFYPPTLNAINVLADKYNKVEVVCRKTTHSKWDYKKNIHFFYTTPYYNNYEIEKIKALKKSYYFLKFTLKLFQRILRNNVNTILIYDPIALLSYSLISSFKKKQLKVWYHNHDIIEINNQPKYSILWLAAKFEKRNIKKNISVFSLPSYERLEYFKPLPERISFFCIPNYPSLNHWMINLNIRNSINDSTINLLYQGSIGPSHGLEDILKNIVGCHSNNRIITLSLIGKYRNKFKKEFLELAKKLNKNDYINFEGQIPYLQLKNYTLKYHIGLAIHESIKINYETAALASNKIYEYIACGLPVILYDTPHYREYLERYPWAFFTDLSKASLILAIQSIFANYHVLSKKAYQDFKDHLHFEKVFKEIFNKIDTIEQQHI